MKFKSLFLENIGIRQTILKNTFWLTAAEVVSGFLRLFLLIWVARLLGANEYGKFTFAFSFVSVMVILSDMGIIDIVTREFARNKEKEKEFSALLVLELILSIGTFVLMVIGSFFITVDPYIRRLIWILGLFILSSSFFGIFCSFLRSRQKMEGEAVIKVLHTVLLVGLSFVGIFYFPSALFLGLSYLVANVLFVVGLIVFFHVQIQQLRLVFDKKVFNILKISWPLSLGYVPVWVYIAISSVMLGYFNLITENGWYNAASKIALVAMIPAELIIRSFYPALSNFFVNFRGKLQVSFNYLMALMIFLALPIMVGGITLAPGIIHFFYGPHFNSSIFSFQLLMLVVAITFLHYPFSIMLVVFDHQKTNFFLIVVGMVITTILNIALIPAYGLSGATVSVLVSSLIVLVLTVIVYQRLIRLPLFNAILALSGIVAGLSSLMMFLVIRLPWVYNLNIFYSVGIGVATYVALSFIWYVSLKPFTKYF